MRKIIPVFVVAFMIASLSASGAAIALGTSELRLNGGIDFKSPAGTDIAIQVGYGYFIADYLAVGGLAGFYDNDLISGFEIGGFTEYNIETETNFIPYGGLQLRYVYSEINLGGARDTSALALGIYAGGKLFITDNLALNARLLFDFATDDVYVNKAKTTNTDTALQLGLSYFF